MKPLRLLPSCLLPLLLAGCLEVEQHPGWQHGQYDGKPDNLPAQANFHNDRLYWYATVTDRNHLQNEYNRAHP